MKDTDRLDAILKLYKHEETYRETLGKEGYKFATLKEALLAWSDRRCREAVEGAKPGIQRKAYVNVRESIRNAQKLVDVQKYVEKKLATLQPTDEEKS